MHLMLLAYRVEALRVIVHEFMALFFREALVEKAGDEFILYPAPTGAIAVDRMMRFFAHVVAEHDLITIPVGAEPLEKVDANGIGIILGLAGAVINDVATLVENLLVIPVVGVAVEMRATELLGIKSHGLDYLDLLEAIGADLGMGVHGHARISSSSRTRTHALQLHWGDVHIHRGAFDPSCLYVRAIDAFCDFPDVVLVDLILALVNEILAIRESRRVLHKSRTCHNLHTRLLRQNLHTRNVASIMCTGIGVNQGSTSVGSINLSSFKLLLPTLKAPFVIGIPVAREIHEHMLVGHREAHFLRIYVARYGSDSTHMNLPFT